MTQPEFLPLLNALVALLLAGNIFFIKKLIDRVEKTMEVQQNLDVRVAVVETKLKLGKQACPSERKEKEYENAF